MPETGPTMEASKGQEPSKRFSSAIKIVVAESEALRKFRDELDSQGSPKHSPTDCAEFRERAEGQLVEDAKDPKNIPASDDLDIKLQPNDDPSRPVNATYKVMERMRRSSLALMGKIDTNLPLSLMDLKQIMIDYNTIKAFSEGTADIPNYCVPQVEAFFAKLEGIVRDPLVRLILERDKLNRQGK
jgi:hypothetical protein